MPLYEYQCTKCSRITEKRQKFSDPELTECPHCGGKLERTISAPAVQFKGGGWYADLYSSSKGGSKPAAAGGEGASASSGESKTSSSGESSSSTPSTPAPAPAPASGK